MNKKIIMMIGAILLSQITSTASAGTVGLSVNSSSNSYQVGDVFSILIEGIWTPDVVTNDLFDDLISGGIDVSFNKNTLQVNTGGNGVSLLAPSEVLAVTGDVSNTLGIIEPTGFYTDLIAPGSFQMASIEFLAIAEGLGDINVTSTADLGLEWFDGNGETPTVNISNASISVSAVPVPAAIWFMGTGLVSFLGFRKKTVLSK